MGGFSTLAMALFFAQFWMVFLLLNVERTAIFLHSTGNFGRRALE